MSAAGGHDSELSCFIGLAGLAFHRGLKDLGIGPMRFSVILLASAALCAAAGAANAASVEVRDAVARVIVIPEDRADVKVEFLTAQ